MSRPQTLNFANEAHEDLPQSPHQLYTPLYPRSTLVPAPTRSWIDESPRQIEAVAPTDFHLKMSPRVIDSKARHCHYYTPAYSYYHAPHYQFHANPYAYLHHLHAQFHTRPEPPQAKKLFEDQGPVAHMYTTEQLYRDHVSESSSTSHAPVEPNRVAFPHEVYEQQARESTLK